LEIGERIRAARKAAGMTQEEVARRTNLTLKAFGELERGDVRDPHISSLASIARALGVGVMDLLEEPVLAGKAEAPSPGPYEDGNLIVSMPYEGANEGLKVLEEAERVAKERVKHYPDHAVILDTRVVRGERVEVYFESPHPVYGPWLEFANRYADRWEQRIAEGALDQGSVDEFMSTLEDFQPILIRLGRQERQEQGPDYHSTYGPTISEATRRIMDLFNPMIREGTKVFEENDLARLRRERDELASGRVRASGADAEERRSV
jgi:transcriptional regulator with XRE-family HTH domain